jgi:serine/threonine-protein kinase SRPK3
MPRKQQQVKKNIKQLQEAALSKSFVSEKRSTTTKHRDDDNDDDDDVLGRCMDQGEKKAMVVEAEEQAAMAAATAAAAVDDAKKRSVQSRESSDVSESEDEGTEDYRKGGYHPVRLGDWFKQGRYVVQRKLGWGHFSTVWLAWDTHEKRFVALKVQKSAQHYMEAAIDEVTILKQIAEGDPEDCKGVVKLLDHFKHAGPNGNHVCMVFEYLGDNLLTLIKHYNYRGLPLHMVKQVASQILVGLDYLHHQLSIIHTDLKPENVLLLSPINPAKHVDNLGNVQNGIPVENQTMMQSGFDGSDVRIAPSALSKSQKKKQKLKRRAKKVDVNLSNPSLVGTEENVANNSREGLGDVEPVPAEAADSRDTLCKDEIREKCVEETETEHEESSPAEQLLQKSAQSCIPSRELKELDLRCKIVDLGNACWTYKQFTSDIQTRQYRCPEVLLGSKYSTSADMWSFACIVFELATGDVLFDPRSGEDFDRDEVSKFFLVKFPLSNCRLHLVTCIKFCC